MNLPRIEVPLVEKRGLIYHVSQPWLLFFNRVHTWVTAPAHTNSNGQQGQMAYDQNGYFYLCTSKNTWLRFGPGSNAF